MASAQIAALQRLGSKLVAKRDKLGQGTPNIVHELLAFTSKGNASRAKALPSVIRAPVSQPEGSLPEAKQFFRIATEKPSPRPETPKPQPQETPLKLEPEAMPPQIFPQQFVPQQFGPSPFQSQLSAGDVGRAVVGAGGCDLLPEPYKTACKFAGQVLGGPGTSTSTPTLTEKPCKPGTVKVGNQCVSPGDAFPGGAPMFTPAGGGAVIGGFGLPALVPTIVGAVANKWGQTVPIRRCPSMMVLGRDNLCYPKALLPRRSRLRKHRPGPRPPMTGADAQALRRLGTLQHRVMDLAASAGLQRLKPRKGAIKPKRKR